MDKKKSFLTKLILLGATFAIGFNASIITASKASESTTFLEEDYGTLSLNSSKAYSKDGCAGGNSTTHGVVPTKTWSGTINAATGNIIYKLNATTGNAFETFKLDLNGMARNDLTLTNGDPITLAGFNIYIAELPTDFSKTADAHIDPVKGSGAYNVHTFDFSTQCDGLSTIYVKVELLHTTGSVSLSNCGTKLRGIKFYGNEKASDYAYVTKADTYNVSGVSSASCHFDKMNNVGGFGNSNGVVPTKNWTGTILTAKDAYIIYSLSTPVGATFENLSIALNARVWAKGVGEYDGKQVSTQDSSIKLYISSDDKNFGDAIKVIEAGDISGAQNYNYVDYDKCIGSSIIYIKIELDTPIMKVSLSQCGPRLYSASISGCYDKRKCVESTPFEDTISLSQEYENFEKTGTLKTTTIDSKQYIYVSNGDTASIVIPFECDTLYNFFNLTYTQLIRCTTYGSAEQIKEALTFFISIDGKSFTKLESLDTDVSWAKKSISLNLSSYVKDNHKGYIKVSFDWHGRLDSHDWIAIGDIALIGDLVERENYDIFYLNMEDATNDPDNPNNYDAGTVFTFKTASKDHYSFGGWYLDELFEEEITQITAETKDDLYLYAKWNPDNITVTLNAGNGQFIGGSKTKDISASYNLPLSKTKVDEPTCEGLGFINWFIDPEFINQFIFIEDYGEPTIITSSITLYAKFATPAKVTYKYNDEITTDVVFNQEVGQKANRVEDPTLYDHKFGGWYLGENLYDFNASLVGDITLTAKWYEIFDIHYLGIEGATHENPSTFTADLKTIDLGDATKKGYTFLGWYIGDARYDVIDTKQQNDVTLTAKWEIIYYDIDITCDEYSSVLSSPNKITVEGGVVKINVTPGHYIYSVLANNVSIPFDNNNEINIKGFDQNVLLEVETRESYYYNGSFDISFKDNANYAEYAAGLNNVNVYTSDKTSKRYGYLVNQDYTKAGYITYAIDAGEGKSLNSLTLTGTARIFSYNGSVTKLELYFSKDGINYTLINSYPSTTDGEAMTQINVNLTSYAKGERFAYIRYEIQGGSYDWVALEGVHANMSYTCSTVKFIDGTTTMYTNNDQITGDKIILVENPSKNGFKFLGWYSDSKFRNKVDANYIVEEDMNVYAKWEAIIYNINYIVGDGASIGDNPESYTAEDEIILNPAEKHNYKFVGWYDNPTLSNDPITKINKNTTGEITLFAKFQEGTAITYNLNGGNNSELNPEVYFFDEETYLFDAYRDGYVFVGWYSEPEFINMITSIEEGTHGPVTLYAQWIEDKSEEESNGCGGSITASIGAITITSLIGLAIISLKRKER